MVTIASAWYAPMMTEAEVVREVVRIYERYAVEVVEHFGLCPWALPARRAGAVAVRVILAENLEDLRPSLGVIDSLETRSEVSIGLIIYPSVALGRLDFERAIRLLRQADADRRAPRAPSFAMAPFHPAAGAVLDSPERLVPFVRRSPDPTLQLVRSQALEALRHGDRSGGSVIAEPWMLGPAQPEGPGGPERAIPDRVGLRNLETVTEVGPAAIEAVLADIDRDRRASYLRVGLPALSRSE